MKLIVDDKIPFIRGVLEPFFNIEYMEGSDIRNKHLIDVDGLIIRTRTKCNKSLLEGSGVKAIATATIGFDHIDTNYCEQKNIKWFNASGCNSSSVKQYIASTLVFLAKKHGFSLEDRTIGIIGVGNVGRKVLRITESLGMRVVLNDPPRQRAENSCAFISMEGILRETDIITLHVPLNYEGEDKTYHMVDAEFLDKVNPGTVIINTSRGEVVDNNALKYSLKNGNVTGAVLDVWENEPDIDQSLLNLVDLATPHIAGYSQDGKANGTAMSVDAICNFFNIPFTGWYPESVPLPSDNKIIVDCNGKNNTEILSECMINTYNVETDDIMLRQNIRNFEKNRGNYPVRREYGSYEVKLLNAGDEEIYLILKNLGFKMI